MRGKRMLSVILLIAFAFQIAAAQQGELASKTISLDKTAFDQSLVGAVGPKVMGYQYVLIKDGKVVTEKADGTARTTQDGGPLKMTVNTPIKPRQPTEVHHGHGDDRFDGEALGLLARQG